MQASKVIFYLTLLSTSFFGISVMAQSNVVAKVQTVSADRNKILLILNSGASLYVGQTLRISSDCQVTLQQVKDGRAMASAEMCMNKNVLTVGQNLYVEGGSSVPSDSYTPYEEHLMPVVRREDTAKGLAIFGSLQSTSATVSIDGQDVGVSNNDAQSVALEVGYLYIPRHSLGFIGRLTAGSKIAGDGWGSFSYLRPEFDGTFGFTDFFYLLFGLNGTSYSGSGFSSMDMGIGVQVGVGFKVHEHTLFEVEYITSSHTYNAGVFGDVSVNFGSLALSVGYLF